MADTPLVHLDSAQAEIARANGHTVFTLTQELSTTDWATPLIVPKSPVTVGSLLLNEDFSKVTSLDQTIFTPDWFTPTSKMNGVTTDPNNVAIKNGQLSLTLSSATDGALVSTNPTTAKPGFSYTDAYVEASITFPSVNGSLVNWPAFWSDGQNWPATGEFDIAEVLGGQMTTNYHYGTSASPVSANSGPIPGNWTGKHIYAMSRRAGVQTVYFDGKVVCTRTSVVSDPHYIIFNHGVSGTPVIGAQLLIDYVRVWA